MDAENPLQKVSSIEYDFTQHYKRFESDVVSSVKKGVSQTMVTQ
jgi:hypothetical protein